MEKNSVAFCSACHAAQGAAEKSIKINRQLFAIYEKLAVYFYYRLSKRFSACSGVEIAFTLKNNGPHGAREKLGLPKMQHRLPPAMGP